MVSEEPSPESSKPHRSGALYRYQFLQVLVKLAVARYVSADATDISDAVDKFMTEKVMRNLPSEARVDANTFREETLYTLEVEAVLRNNLRSLHAVFEGYAGAGPTGQPDLLSLPEWLSLCTHLDLFDREFTPREAALAFQWSRMKAVDELKGRSRLLNVSFIDFFEALMRMAMSKRLPTPDILRKAGRRTAGEYYLELRRAPSDVYNSYLETHAQACVASGDKVGMRAHMALEALLSVVISSIRGFASNGAATDLTVSEVESFMRTQGEKMREGKLAGGAPQTATPLIPDMLAGISLPPSGDAAESAE